LTLTPRREQADEDLDLGASVRTKAAVAVRYARRLVAAPAAVVAAVPGVTPDVVTGSLSHVRILLKPVTGFPAVR
jgi:hypothetical protein